jgi:hypothetical protein
MDSVYDSALVSLVLQARLGPTFSILHLCLSVLALCQSSLISWLNLIRPLSICTCSPQLLRPIYPAYIRCTSLSTQRGLPLIVTNPRETPTFSPSSCLQCPLCLGATSGRTSWNPRLSSGTLVTPYRALSPLGSKIMSPCLWIVFSTLSAVSPSQCNETPLFCSPSDAILILAHSEHHHATLPLLSCPAHPPIAPWSHGRLSL